MLLAGHASLIITLISEGEMDLTHGLGIFWSFLNLEESRVTALGVGA